MIVIALLLLAVVIFLIVAALTEQSNAVSVDVFNVNIDTTVAEIFIAGVVAGLLTLAALVLLRLGMRRSRLRRQEMRELRRQAHATPARDDTPARGDTPADDDIVADRRGAATNDTDRRRASTDDTVASPPAASPRGQRAADGPGSDPSDRPADTRRD